MNALIPPPCEAGCEPTGMKPGLPDPGPEDSVRTPHAAAGRSATAADGPAPDYDLVGEDWFDDAQAMQAAFASPEGKAVIDDPPNFADMSRFRLMVTEEEEVPLPEARK
jgi:hypothetical protein